MVITCTGATTDNGGTEAAVGFSYRISGALGANTWGSITAVTTTGLSLTVSSDNMLVWIELDPADLASADYNYVKLLFTDTTDMDNCLVAVLGVTSASVQDDDVPISDRVRFSIMNNLANQNFTGIVGETISGGGTPPLRRLAIVGSHPATVANAPWNDLGVEIWLFNEAPQKTDKYPRWDACLQIHREEVYSSLTNWVNKDHWEWLQQDHGNKKIWMQDVDSRVPNSVKYPLDEILAMTPFRYMRSSPAMALALAVYLGYKHIEIYGSELSSNTEYAYQGPNFTFWMGYALGHGVDLQMKCWEREFFQPIYGYDGEWQISKSDYQTRFDMHRAAFDNNDRLMTKTVSRLHDAMLENKFDAVGKISLELEAIATTTGETSGAMGEAEYYLGREDMISRQEFERRSAQAQLDGERLQTERHHAGGKCEYVWNVWRQTGRNEALKQLRGFLDEKTKLAYEMGVKLGVYRENVHYIEQYDAGVIALGGARALSHVLPQKVEA